MDFQVMNLAFFLNLVCQILSCTEVEDETPNKLMKYRVRGMRFKNTEPGNGLGLTDAKLAAELLGISFKYSIEQFKHNPSLAWHIYTLDLANVISISKIR